MAVSLPQITNMAVDEQRATGQPAVVIDNSQAINNVLQAANMKAQNDWRKYQQFLENQSNFFKNAGDIAKIEVATQDREAISKGYKDILQQAMQHPEIFHGRNQKLFNELQGMSGQLMQQATESKMNRVYDMAHREYLLKNPELNTPENIQKVESYFQQPLGKRQNYMLEMAGLFNPDELAKNISAQVEQPYADTRVVGGLEEKDGQQIFAPGEKFIYEEEGKKYDPNKFLTISEQAYNLPDKRGVQLRTTVEKRFQNLDPAIQQQYGGNAKNWYMDLMKSRIPQTAVSKKNLQANPNAYKAEEIKQRWASIGIARERMEQEKVDDILSADTVLNEALSILDKGEPNIVEYGGVPKELLIINDPFLLQSFGRLDKDNKMVNVPDEVQYDKDKGELLLTYFEKDWETGDISKTASGKRKIREQKGMDEKSWLKSITKRSFPNKNIGTVNSLVDKVLNEGGNSLYKLSQAQKQPKATDKTVQDYDVPTQTTIKQWMKKNKVTDETEALNYLRGKKYID